jgi:hypothetical protein
MRGGMTARPLAPVIPSSAVPAGRQRARSAAGRPLPLAHPIPAPSLPEDVVYGIGRIDASGRIADRTVISALGWRGGDRLTLTADAGIVTARRDPGGMITLPGRAYVAIPAELHRHCGLQPGDRVPRRNARDGRSAAENLIAALRCLYRHAQDDGLIDERDDPAGKVDKPRRLPSTRRA